jgi:hypothetical protein
MVSYLGAFPFGQDAPVVLGFEQMIMVRHSLLCLCRVEGSCSAIWEFRDSLVQYISIVEEPIGRVNNGLCAQYSIITNRFIIGGRHHDSKI